MLYTVCTQTQISLHSQIKMDPDQYEAAAKGKIEFFNKLAKDQLGSIVTHNKNTVLHVNIASQTHKYKTERESRSIKFVEGILDMCSLLLIQANAKDNAPLHVAARYGHAAVAEALIKFGEKKPNLDLEIGVESTQRHMLGMRNKEENTALHEAVQSGSLGVVKILLEADPDFLYSANGNGETPLYLAAARAHEEIVAEILRKCPSAADEGPNGKTALHAAVCNNRRGVTKLLLDKKKSLTKARDRHGWTPLHYAAYFDRFSITKLLLEADKSVALIPDEDRKMTALHLAAGQRNISAVLEIIDHCPECCELVDLRGWNVLHFAMVSFNAYALKGLLRIPIVRNLIFEKDEKGNTPFHVLAAVICRQLYNVGYDIVPGEIAESYYQAVNNQNISAEHIYRYGFPDLEQEIQEFSKADGNGQYPNGVVIINKNKEEEIVGYSFWKSVDENAIGMKEASQSHLVVAALIATVTFAAAFTLPGGHKSETEDGPNRGTAILTKNAAFQVFIISDAIAMAFSLSAVFVHFILSLKLFRKFIVLFVFALLFTLVAMVAMVIAFITGTYAVLSPSLGLTVVSCFLGTTFFWSLWGSCAAIMQLLLTLYQKRRKKNLKISLWFP